MKKLMPLIILALVTAFLALPPQVQADEDQPHICFRTLDGDRDGKVTVEEFKEGYPKLDAAKFKALDKDSSGFLSHDEYHDALGHGSLG